MVTRLIYVALVAYIAAGIVVLYAVVTGDPGDQATTCEAER